MSVAQRACLLMMAAFYLSVMVSGKQTRRRAGRWEGARATVHV